MSRGLPFARTLAVVSIYGRGPSCGCRSPVMRTSRKSSPRARRERPRLTATLEVTRRNSPSAVMPRPVAIGVPGSHWNFRRIVFGIRVSVCCFDPCAYVSCAGGGRAVVYATLRLLHSDAGWSSPVARWAHNPKVAGSNPAPATISFWSIPDTWVTVHSDHIGNTFGPNGFSIGSSRHVSSSK